MWNRWFYKIFKLVSDIHSFYNIFVNKITLITNSSENEVVRYDDWLEKICRRIFCAHRNFYDGINFYEHRNFCFFQREIGDNIHFNNHKNFDDHGNFDDNRNFDDRKNFDRHRNFEYHTDFDGRRNFDGYRNFSHRNFHMIWKFSIARKMKISHFWHISILIHL